MKTFAIIHYLVADSGHVITVVKAENEAEAWSKYKEEYPHRWHIGMSILEVTGLS